MIPSVMQHDFSRVPKINRPRSAFNHNHGYTSAFDSGKLIPILVAPVYPGDTHNVHLEAFLRLTTPVKPALDNLWADTHFYFCPNRLVHSNFVKMMGEQENPGDSIDFLEPIVTIPNGGVPEQSLLDYMGIPLDSEGVEISAIPLRAHNLIFNKCFRDENMQDSLPVPMDDGPDDLADYDIYPRGRRYDYFTQALPWPQKGDPVTIGIAGMASVVPVDSGSTLGVPNSPVEFNQAGFGTVSLSANGSSGNVWTDQTDGGTPDAVTAQVVANGIPAANFNGFLQANLSTAAAVTIDALNEAVQMQSFLQRDGRGGTRYTELIQSHFDVISPDARLQIPEYLGGGTSPITFHPVAQTTAGPATPTNINAQGNLAAFATASLRPSDHGFNKAFVEHGFIIGYISIRADQRYQQGLQRFWSRRSRFDYAWPEFSHLGEQAILEKEIFCQAQSVIDPDTDEPWNETVFGYVPRYDDLRYFPSLITGRMRSTASTPLDVWHYAVKYEEPPVLDAAFIEDVPPVDRNLAVQNEPEFYADLFFHYTCVRAFPTYGIPGFGARF